MARKTLIVKLRNETQPSPEGVAINHDNSWKSPGGGWLPIQAGLWDETPDGVHLKNAIGNEHVADLRGLHFHLCAAGDHGKALYPSIAGTGGWSVEEVIDE